MPDGILNWRKCKRCGEFYDIKTNWNICSKCRKEVEKLKDGMINNGNNC